jgi:hypothetical protein
MEIIWEFSDDFARELFTNEKTIKSIAIAIHSPGINPCQI